MRDNDRINEKFVEEWALKAWEQEMFFEGSLTGGIAPVKRLVRCKVQGNTVSIGYKYPETCGLSDVRYHVSDHDRLRTDTFEFTEDGRILMNGNEFPGVYSTDPWTKDEARDFLEEYSAALNS